MEVAAEAQKTEPRTPPEPLRIKGGGGTIPC